jgi:hypothetical protein
MSVPNSLQAVLDRQAAAQTLEVTAPRERKFLRPSREGMRFIGGHFAPKIAKQLRLLAAEEETTVQALLEQALDDLFMKKASQAGRNL